MNSKLIMDAATWVATLSVAAVTALANQDLSTGHGKVLAAAAVLGVVAAGLKSAPDFSKDVSPKA